jgi:hypothetical protein
MILQKVLFHGHCYWSYNYVENRQLVNLWTGKILKRKLDLEKMVHNNFVVLDKISQWLKLMYVLISNERKSQGVMF